MVSAVLAGCQEANPEEPILVASPSPRSTERLVQGAEAVYEHYLRAVQVVSEHGNSGYEDLKPYLTADGYRDEVTSFEYLRSKGVHTEGASRLLEFQLQSADSATGDLLAYACVDLSKVRVFDASGADVTPSGRPSRQTSLVTFTFNNNTLLVEKNGSWSGDSIC